jgi:hypothetical protein
LRADSSQFYTTTLVWKSVYTLESPCLEILIYMLEYNALFFHLHNCQVYVDTTSPYVCKRVATQRENYHIQVYLSFIQHRSLEVVCNSKLLFLGWFGIGINLEDLELDYSRGTHSRPRPHQHSWGILYPIKYESLHMLRRSNCFPC